MFDFCGRAPLTWEKHAEETGKVGLCSNNRLIDPSQAISTPKGIDGLHTMRGNGVGVNNRPPPPGSAL